MSDSFWGDIPGCDNAKRILLRFFQNEKIPHALLFYGTDGVGKDFIALRFSALMNGLPAVPPSPDDKVFLFESFLKVIFPLPVGKGESAGDGPYDKFSAKENEAVIEQLNAKKKNPYHVIQVPKANDIKINSIRDINRFLSLSYEQFNYRVILISQAHLMNETAQNALLKMLEEPPPNVVFILTTSQPHRLLETIRSRCRAVPFAPLDTASMESILTRYFNISESDAHAVSPLALGSVTNALSLLEADILTIRQRAVSFIRVALGAKIDNAFDEISFLVKDPEKEAAVLFLKSIIFWINDYYRYRAGLSLVFFSDFSDTISRFCAKFPSADFSEVVSSYEQYISAIQHQNSNLNIVLLNCTFDLSAVINPSLQKERFRFTL